MQHEDPYYGQKVYREIDGVWYLVALRPTLRPHPGEYEAGFIERAERMYEILAALPTVVSIDLLYDYRADVVVACQFFIELVPECVPATAGDRPTGRAEVRGTRGGIAKKRRAA